MGGLLTRLMMVISVWSLLSACGGGGADTPPAGVDAAGPTDAATHADTMGPEDTTSPLDVDAPIEDAPAPNPDVAEEDAPLPPQPDVVVPPDTPAPPGPPTVDCSAIPQGPFELVKLDGPLASEDLAFDRDGHLVGSNDNAIFKTLYDGQPQVFVPNISFRAGLRYLPSGQLIVCNNHTGQLIRVDEEGTQHVVLSGLSYPNGVTVDLQGWVYFTEHDNQQVRRVHPYTGEYTILTNEVSSPNGLTFSPDYTTLYIGGFNGQGTVYAMSISPDGVPGKLVPWATDVGTGWLDGMATDACGNIYIADYGATVIYRISPDGQTKEKVISGAGFSNAYLPNMQWGSGVGGWNPMHLYLPDGWNKGVFEVQLGVPSAPVPYP